MKINRTYSACMLASAAIALALTACNNGDRPDSVGTAAPGQDAAAKQFAYQKEIADLKAKAQDPAKEDLAIRETLLRYGYPIPEAAQPHYGMPDAALNPIPQGAGLAKTAGTISKFFIIKEATFGYVPRVDVTVPANSTVEAWTTHPGKEDPMLVGFYRASDLGNNRYTIREVGVGDDENGGLDAKITWKNTTGSSRLVSLVAFAYNSSLTGSATLNYRINAGLTKKKAFQMDAAKVTGSNPISVPAGCTGPTMSLLNMYKVWGQLSEYALLGVNRNTHRGGWSFVNPDLTLLEDIMPRDAFSFILAYKLPTGSVFEESGYRANQTDAYSCPG